MRLIFFGSGAFGLPTLERLAADHEIAAVVSQPDRPAGRKRALTPTPIAAWAQSRGLKVLKDEKVNDPAFVQRLIEFEADASVVIAFGQKLCPALITAMGRLAVNLHASLLPRYRGAAPINRAIINGERQTGVSVIALAQRMDAGAVYAMASTPIEALETAGELHERLALLGPAAVSGVLRDLEAGTLEPRQQDHAAATPAPKLSKTQGTVDFDQPAEAVRARVHGLTPWPGCRVRWEPRDGGEGRTIFLRRVKAHGDGGDAGGGGGAALPAAGGVGADRRVACAPGWIELLEVQAPGGRVLPLEAFLRGHRLVEGDWLRPI